jgi:hypothetical protein
MFIGTIEREVEECAVGYQLAVRQSQFTKTLPVSQEGSNRVITNLSTLVKIDFKDIRAILSKGKYRIVLELFAIVEFKLEIT